MKKNYKFLLMLVALLCLAILYICTDSKLYFYGRTNFNILNNSLPLGLKPSFWGTDVSYPIQGFVIEDNYGFLIIGKGKPFKFGDKTFKIDEIINYGYNNETLITLVKAVDGNHYYIEHLLLKDMSSTDGIRTNIYDDDKEINTNDYKWVEIKYDGNLANNLIRLRVVIVLISILLVPAWLLIRRILKEAKSQA